MRFQRISYDSLNAKQKEKYNYQKVSALLADYGFITVPLSDDWNGADFLAIHKDGDVLKVQLKGRMTLDKKYIGKDLHICFRYEEAWYICPHDQLLETVGRESNILQTESWINEGKYSFPTLSAQNRLLLKQYELAS